MADIDLDKLEVELEWKETLDEAHETLARRQIDRHQHETATIQHRVHRIQHQQTPDELNGHDDDVGAWLDTEKEKHQRALKEASHNVARLYASHEAERPSDQVQDSWALTTTAVLDYVDGATDDAGPLIVDYAPAISSDGAIPDAPAPPADGADEPVEAAADGDDEPAKAADGADEPANEEVARRSALIASLDNRAAARQRLVSELKSAPIGDVRAVGRVAATRSSSGCAASRAGGASQAYRRAPPAFARGSQMAGGRPASSGGLGGGALSPAISGASAHCTTTTAMARELASSRRVLRSSLSASSRLRRA